MYFVSKPIITNGLVMYLDAGNKASYTSGSSVWNDLSGNNNSGSLQNNPGYNSANGGSIVFDGSDDYVTLGNNSIANITSVNNFTVSIWLLRSADGSGIGVVHKGPITGTDYDWMVYLGGTNSVQFYKKNTSNTGAAVTGFNIDLNIIVNISIVLSSDLVYFYKNGILVSSSSLPGDIRTSSDPFKIGRGWDGSFDGKIYNTQIYNRALSLSEVQQNFNTLKGRYGL